MKYDQQGLVPVVAQDRSTGEIRMVAYANAEAIEKTRTTGRATFFSRSRQSLWTKGESSGNQLDVHEVLTDCDEDCLVYLVTPHGPTCHTGAESCFGGAATTTLARLETTLDQRKTSTSEKSYAKSLFENPPKIGEKLREEAGELAAAIAGETDARVVSEAADVLFHLAVGLRSRGIALADVLRELDRRAGTSGHAEKAARG